MTAPLCSLISHTHLDLFRLIVSGYPVLHRPLDRDPSLDHRLNTVNSHDTTMEAKLAQLEAATEAAQKSMLQNIEALDDATERVKAAKMLLRQMPQEDQERIQVNDTKLPELLDLLARATEEYEISQKTYETNKRYLDLLRKKMGASISSTMKDVSEKPAAAAAAAATDTSTSTAS